MTPRYRVLMLSSPRTTWAPAVTLWASSGAVPVECAPCVSVDELLARVDAGQRWSAALLDGSMPSVDRDVLRRLADRRCPALVVDDGRVVRDWAGLGAAARLSPGFERHELLDALASSSEPVVSPGAAFVPDPSPVRAGPSGIVLACCGPGGTGTSTVAAALAQGCAASGRPTVLLDACLEAEQAMLHDAVEPHAGVQELAEMHRHGTPPPDHIAAVVMRVERRDYGLIAGLRRARFWGAVRPTAYAAAVESLARYYGAVVIDTDADFETESDGGSIDVEDRTAMARLSVARADAVFCVGEPSTKGLHALNRVLVDLANAGVRPERTVPVFNRCVRSARVRSQYVRALADLTPWRGDDAHPPLFLTARAIDDAHRDGSTFPGPMVRALMIGAERAIRTAGGAAAPEPTPRWQRIVPGELGLRSRSGEVA